MKDGLTGNFEKTSLDWQFYLWQTQVGEWLEKLFQSTDEVTLPNWSLPEWILWLLFWTIALSLVAWALWQLYTVFSPYFTQVFSTKRVQRIPAGNAASSFSEVQWLAQSRSLAQQGNYREACRALYQAALQKLDAANLIPAQLSRTDGEYLNCLAILPDPRPYQALIQVHEKLCFSDTPITQDTFHHCEQAYQETETP